jgi:arabinan endo-1,5-alpha-L-arabinosidase
MSAGALRNGCKPVERPHVLHFARGVVFAVLMAGALVGAARSSAPAAPPKERAVERERNAIVNVHDPHAFKEGRYFYVFSTGPGVMIRRSKDLVNWKYVGSVFPDGVPGWARKDVPGASADFIWAPDIALLNGRYYLYYAVSTFGKNRSVIGLATNKTLDPGSSDYRWIDEGKVTESLTTSDYNAIDPALVRIDGKRVALAFGSYWSGVKMMELDPRSGKPLPGAKLLSIAQRPFPDALEAPAIEKIREYYYLFVSWDACCRGVESTYNIRVGRSLKWDGPYADKDGKPLTEGGGTLLLGTEGRVIGPGHCSVLTDGSKRYLVFHFYDGDHNGVPTLQIRPMIIGADGWPALKPAVGAKAP